VEFQLDPFRDETAASHVIALEAQVCTIQSPQRLGVNGRVRLLFALSVFAIAASKGHAPSSKVGLQFLSLLAGSSYIMLFDNERFKDVSTNDVVRGIDERNIILVKQSWQGSILW
jgi:hypothetical protein